MVVELLVVCASLVPCLAQDDRAGDIPPARRVTLALDQVPLRKAVELFSEAAEVPLIGSEDFKRGDRFPSDLNVTLKIKDLPLFDALSAFCKACGEASFWSDGVQVYLFPYPHNGVAEWNTACLRFVVSDIRERASTDFDQTRSECSVGISVCWTPGVIVHSAGPLAVTRAVDDRGRDILPGKPIGVSRIEKPAKRLEFADFMIPLPRPARDASWIVLEGTLDLELPVRSRRMDVPFEAQVTSTRGEGLEASASVEGEMEAREAVILLRKEGEPLDPAALTPVLLKLHLGQEELCGAWVEFKPRTIEKRHDGSLLLRLPLHGKEPSHAQVGVNEGRRKVKASWTSGRLTLPRP